MTGALSLTRIPCLYKSSLKSVNHNTKSLLQHTEHSWNETSFYFLCFTWSANNTYLAGQIGKGWEKMSYRMPRLIVFHMAMILVVCPMADTPFVCWIGSQPAHPVHHTDSEKTWLIVKEKILVLYCDYHRACWGCSISSCKC